MTEHETKVAAKARVADLVRAFKLNEADYNRPHYNETQARTDFITPLLEAFGWDVHNSIGSSLALREVIEESTVEVGEERLSKRPDYELRLARQRKLFVEAKKPSVRIDRDLAPAFQVRRYGYSASLPISVVTNFRQLAIYDCRVVPADTDLPHVARLMLVECDAFETRFDDLWPLLARDSVYSGAFDAHFDIGATRQGADQFDDLFLSQVREWRERLAIDIHANTPGLSAEELTYTVQLFLSRIVFLRICEDREIEKYETLKNLDEASTFASLVAVLRRADEFYNSGLFRLLDDERLGIRISDGVLHSLISELYYPYSPFNFAVVETKVLGEIYEQLLGEIIVVAGANVEIVNTPEVRASGGVVPTPAFIADAIVARTIGPQIKARSPDELTDFTVADICCGSGTFLLSAFELLLDHYLSWYTKHDRPSHAGHRIYEVAGGQWRLTFEEKRRILLSHLRGVDIDANAVEVTQLSLLLKLIEDESADALKDFVVRQRVAALPSLDAVVRCGNSLVSEVEWQRVSGPIPTSMRARLNPFQWQAEFPAEFARGGFDAIVGNPPYVRIQNLVAYAPEEVSYYGSPASPYTTAQQDNFDKYALVVERALTLVQQHGRVGVIVPHKFMSTQAGRTMRRLVTTDHALEEIVHFGVKQVFGKHTSTYSCILILDRSGADSVRLEMTGALESWRYGHQGTLTTIPAADLGEETWQFAADDVRALFARVRAACPLTLSAVAEILVGLQTSADKVFIVHSEFEGADTVTCRWNGREWPIERGILRPVLHDAQLSPYGRVTANAWLIFPYDFTLTSTGSKRASLIQPDELSTRYPLALAYLNARRSELEGRNIVGGSAIERQWYQYGRSQSLTKFDSPKIVLPALSVEPRYAYDDANVMITGGGNGPYYMVRARAGVDISNHYLLALLNHPMSEALVRTNTSTFRGGYYSHGKQFIENLPIPVPDDASRNAIEQLTSTLIHVLDEHAAARTPHERTIKEREIMALKIEIEERVSSAFALTPADLATVLSVSPPA
ncbi:MAG: N-6 DNA methylase [Gemmatimonadaceae bacterium]